LTNGLTGVRVKPQAMSDSRTEVFVKIQGFAAVHCVTVESLDSTVNALKYRIEDMARPAQ
jgi:hypothetical protein